MTDEEIHNIYLHMSGKAEGLVEANGTADFPVLFARAILEYGGLTKDVQNMASKSTYKEQLKTKDEPVAWGMEKDGVIIDVICPEEHAREEGEYTIPLYTTPQLETKDEPVALVAEVHISRYTIEWTNGPLPEATKLYTTPQRTWVKLTDEEMRELEKQFEAERVRTSDEEYLVIYPAAYWQWQRAIEAKLKEKNT